MHFAANGSLAHWTTYDYDEIERTVKLTPAPNAGFTSYPYDGTTDHLGPLSLPGTWRQFPIWFPR